VPACLFFFGCSSPNKANIELRRKIDDLQTKIQDLDRRHDADQATIAGLKSNATIVPSLPEASINELVTTHGLKFGRLTGGADLDPNKPGDDGLKVYVCPIDDQGQALKAAGSFDIDAFDLAQGDGEFRVGHWSFDVKQTRESWYGVAMLYTYVLSCPWQDVPKHSDLTIRVTFTDALTGRQFTAQRQVTANVPK
jgi:hypothetical protein